MIVAIMEMIEVDPNGLGHWEWKAFGPFGDTDLAETFAERWQQSEHRIGEVIIIDLNAPTDPPAVPIAEAPRGRVVNQDLVGAIRWEPEPMEDDGMEMDERGPF